MEPLLSNNNVPNCICCGVYISKLKFPLLYPQQGVESFVGQAIFIYIVHKLGNVASNMPRPLLTSPADEAGYSLELHELRVRLDVMIKFISPEMDSILRCLTLKASMLITIEMKH